jgi:hypothetical protein
LAAVVRHTLVAHSSPALVDRVVDRVEEHSTAAAAGLAPLAAAGHSLVEVVGLKRKCFLFPPLNKEMEWLDTCCKGINCRWKDVHTFRAGLSLLLDKIVTRST